MRLAVLDPGHFHAYLPLRARNPLLDDEVAVFASDAAEAERFSAQIRRFNERQEAPTRWQLRVHCSRDPLAALLSDRPNLAILAGRNRGKLARIRALTSAGIHVLADKPWVVDPTDLADLEAIANVPAHWADMMTERHEPWASAFAALAAAPAVVGDPDPTRGPALSFASVHHLAKLVDGVPLLRPWWYFDVREQGEGLVDVTTHLVDLALGIATARSRGADVVTPRLLHARRWPTDISLDDFRLITGLSAFPAALGASPSALALMANGELGFTCADLEARVQIEWFVRATGGGGDHHEAEFHGTLADLRLQTGAPEKRLMVVPRQHGVEAALAAWSTATGMATIFRGRDGPEVRPVDGSDHETHFSRLLDAFLGDIADPPNVHERVLTLARYRLLSEAMVTARGNIMPEG